MWTADTRSASVWEMRGGFEGSDRRTGVTGGLEKIYHAYPRAAPAAVREEEKEEEEEGVGGTIERF